MLHPTEVLSPFFAVLIPNSCMEKIIRLVMSPDSLVFGPHRHDVPHLDVMQAST